MWGRFSLGVGRPPLTRLGLGMAALGRPGYINLGRDVDFPEGRSREAMLARALSVLDAAFEDGIRYVDAARSYGESEFFLRTWLDARGLTPATLTVGSKWGYAYKADWQVRAEHHEIKNHSLATLRRQYEESRRILGDHLALYQVHSATRESGVLEDEAVLDELGRLRAIGLRVGVTVSGPAQADVIRRALAIERDGELLFTSIQATWNLLERSCESALGEAHAAGRMVILKEVLANGRLTGRDKAGAQPPLARAAKAVGATVDAVAVAAALAQPFADVVLLGAATVDQLRSNLCASQLVLGDDVLVALDSLRVAPAAYWTARAQLAWN